ncbi:hypothetical protein M9458_025946 [Cirrhinus mrigala]|uniref:Uncharacterized protein n=1 Tax=Cirrhinus mrigala TaxID=683832 RepID=A0ABD0PT21_CIRMR
MSADASVRQLVLCECDECALSTELTRGVFAQLEQLRVELTADRESLRSAESLSADLLKEKAQLEKTLETLQQNSDRQVHDTFTRTTLDFIHVTLLSHVALA